MNNCDNIKVLVGCRGNTVNALSTYKTVILGLNIYDGKNRLTLSMLSKSNTKYIIQWDYILTEDIIIPEGCLLDFDGGSIDSEQSRLYSITGLDTILIHRLDKNQVLKNVGLHGTFIDNGWYAADSIIDRYFNLKLNEINSNLMSGVMNIAINTNLAGPVFKGSNNTIAITATSALKGNITIKKNGSTIATGSNVTSYSYNYTGVISDDTTFNATVTVGALSKSSNNIVLNTVYPILYGSGSVYTDAKTEASPRVTPEGVYKITILEDELNILFVVPKNMTINNVLFNGIKIPVDTLNITINDSRTLVDVPYILYKSSNTYDKGTYNITIE